MLCLKVIFFLGVFFSTSFAEQDDKKLGIDEYSSLGAKDNYDVINRARSKYKPKGKNVGGFIAYPSIGVDFFYDNNLRASESDEVEDIGVIIEPEFLLRSDFNRHKIEIKASSDIKRHFEESNENTRNLNLSTNTRIDITRDFKINTELKYGDMNEARTSNLTTASSKDPVEYRIIEGNIGFEHRLNRFTHTGKATISHYNYDDALDINGITPIDMDKRDLSLVNIDGSLSYEFSPGYEIFTKGSYSISDYFNDNTTTNRDNFSYLVITGISLEITNQIVGDIELGYKRKYYDNFSDEGAIIWGAGINWYPSPLLTARLSIDRDIIDGTDANGVAGILQTYYTALVNYEFKRHIIITPKVTYSEADYRGTSDNEKLYILGLQMDHYFNNYLSLFLKYEYSDRQALIKLLNYHKNLMMVGIKFKL